MKPNVVRGTNDTDPALSGSAVDARMTYFLGSSLALWMAVLLAGCRTDMLPAGLAVLPVLVAIIAAARKGSLETIERFLNVRLLFWIAVIQGAAWFALIFVDYFSISYNLMDTGSFAHVVANVANGRGYSSNLFDTPAWADHFAPNLILVAPLYRLWPTFLWLPILRWLAFIACLPVLWRLSGYYLQRTSLRYLVLFMWLTNYPIARVMGFEFQPSSLALPFILLAFSSWLDDRRWLSLLSLIVVLGFKEQMGLVWVCFGIWLIVVRKEPRRGVVIAVAGIVVGLLTVFVLTPMLTGGEPNQHLGRFDPLTFVGDKLVFVVSLVAYVGFFPLAAPRTLLFLLPACSLTLLSGYAAMATLHYHYQDVPGTVVFVAVVIGLAAIERKEGWFSGLPGRLRGVLSTVAVLVLVIANAYFPVRLIRHNWPTGDDLTAVHELHRLHDTLDRDRALYALDSLGPYFVDFAHLRTIDSVRTPWRGNDPRYVVIADGVNQWPIEADYSALEDRLRKLVADGRAARLDTTSVVSAYAVPP